MMSRLWIPRNYLNCKQHVVISIVYTSMIISLHLLGACYATVFHIPLKQYQRHITSQTAIEDSNTIHRYRRQASAPSSADESGFLQSMRGNLHGLSGEGYYIDVNIGTPPQKLHVLIDTGSANFAVACGPDENISRYFLRQNSSTYEEDGSEIYVPYTEGEWTGKLGSDVLALTSASSLTTKANIACITSSRQFYQQGTDWEGILGLGYSGLAQPDNSVTPFWDSLMASHPDLNNVFSVQLCGSSFIHTKDKPLMKGSLILGGIIPSLAVGDFFYTPIYKKWYYEVVMTDIRVKEKSLRVDCKEYNMDKTIVDTGTTTIRLPIKVFEALIDFIDDEFALLQDVPSPGKSFYNGIDTLCFEDMSLPFTVFPVVSFYLMESSNTSFRLDLTPQHYLRPITTSSESGEITQSCVKFGFASSDTGTVLGAVLMEAFYVVFDRENSQIGFAQTSCPLPDPRNKILNTTIQGPFTSNKELTACAFQKPDSGEQTFLATSYILLAIAMVLVIPLILMCVFRVKRAVDGRRTHQMGDDFSETQTFSTAMAN